MNTQKDNFPLSIALSFEKLFDDYRSNINSDNDLLKERAHRVLKIADEYPILTDGIVNNEELSKMMPQVDIILEDPFSSMLGRNEIKIASFPFHQTFFKSSQRYRSPAFPAAR